jgi:hypothetical protein
MLLLYGLVLLSCTHCHAGRTTAFRGLAQQGNVSESDDLTDAEDSATRAALLSIYEALGGPSWNWLNQTNGLGEWGTPGLSYCDWFGVGCCASSPLQSALVPCQGASSVVTLNMVGPGQKGGLMAACMGGLSMGELSMRMGTRPAFTLPTCPPLSCFTQESFGLAGTMPEALGSLSQLTVLNLGQNPALTGLLPEATTMLKQLLWLSVVVSGDTCIHAGFRSG